MQLHSVFCQAAQTLYVYHADPMATRSMCEMKFEGATTISSELELNPMPWHLEGSRVHVWNPFWLKPLLPGQEVIN